MGELNLDILVRPLGGGALIRDYLAADPKLAPFFAGSPFDPEAYRRKAAEIRSRFDPERLQAMAGAIHPLGDEARDKLDRIAAGEGFVVTTGQQPGLFGGPLYTVHKVLTAIALARALEGLLDVPVLALFWTASDDHDWAEANHVHILDLGNTLHRLELEGEPDSTRSMGARPLGTGAENTLDNLAELLPPSEFTEPLLERLRTAYSEGTVAEAFRRTLESTFDGLPLGLVDAQDPMVRKLGEGVIRRSLELGEAEEEVLAGQTARLEQAGYKAQVPVLPGASNVFYEDGTGRERLVRDGSDWALRRSGRRLSPEELEAVLGEAPERFSGNVVLRPVVESAVFPTLAYVGGPGEVSYLAQTACLFEAHEIGMPLVYPRLSVTLLEKKVLKVLEKFGLTVDDFDRPLHELVADVVREDIPAEVEAAVGRLRGGIQSGYEGVYEAAREIDPTLKGPIFQARSDAFRGLAEVEKKIRQHIKARNETGLEQLEKAASNIAPLGKPQERILNIHQYEARYGRGIPEAILERMEIRLDGMGAEWSGPECG